MAAEHAFRDEVDKLTINLVTCGYDVEDMTDAPFDDNFRSLFENGGQKDEVIWYLLKTVKSEGVFDAAIKHFKIEADNCNILFIHKKNVVALQLTKFNDEVEMQLIGFLTGELTNVTPTHQINDAEFTKLIEFVKTLGLNVVDITDGHANPDDLKYKTDTVYFVRRVAKTESIFHSVSNLGSSADNARMNIILYNAGRTVMFALITFTNGIKITLTRTLKEKDLECDICLEVYTKGAYQCANCGFIMCESCKSQVKTTGVCFKCRQAM